MTSRHSILPASTAALRPSLSTTTSATQSTQSSQLQARINAKRAELENLKGLRDLSADLAAQLGQLETRLATLRDGTESVALVLANWENVLRAIQMAALKIPQPAPTDDETKAPDHEREPELPVPLVRIPVQSKAEEDGGR